MNRITRFESRDWLAVVGFFIASFVLRAPFRSELAYHWDSAEFALAVQQYNVTLSQPHAPGYFLYVMLGRLVNLFLGNPHASLVWISVVFGSALPGVMYLLGASMFGRRTGVAAAVFAATSPQTWFHSCVALTYVVDGFLICVTVVYCWYAMNRGGMWRDAIVIGALLAVVGGVRQQSVPALVPLILFTFWKFESRRFWKLVVAAAVSMALAAGWFFPMVSMSGGLPLYLETVRRHTAFNAPATLAGGGEAFRWNVFFAALFCVNGLMLAAVVLVGGLAWRTWRMSAEHKARWNTENRSAVTILAAWLVPMALMGTAVGFTKQPGYVLSYLPGLILLAGLVTAQVRMRLRFVVATTTVCVLNAWAFLAWPIDWDGALFGLGRTAREIRQHDRQLERTVNAIRFGFSPIDTVVFHAKEYLALGLRHFQLYLPEFVQYQLASDPAMISPSDRQMISLKEGRLQFVNGIDFTGKRWAALIVPPGVPLSVYAPSFDISQARLVEAIDGTVYVVPVEDYRR